MTPKVSPLHALGLALALTHGGRLAAQCTVEGTVTIPRVAAASASAHYQLTSGQVAKPPPMLAVIYLEGAPAAPASSGKTVVLGQKDYQFAQSVVPVQAGTRIEFPNFDGDYHNVFSYSKTKRFDLGRYLKGETPPAVVFDKPGLIRLFCEIHQHMRGYILVLDTPYFITTSPDGRFKLSGLPAGSFKLKAWLDEKTTLERPVTLQPGRTFRVDFSPALVAR